MPWGLFDGAAGGDPIRCVGGAALYFNAQNYLLFKARFGEGSNNFVELNALRLLLTKALEWGVQSIQIFGDFEIIINWENGIKRCHILRLMPLLDEVLLLKLHFDYISFTHVYRERSSLVDRLSKEGAQLQEGEDSTECFLRDPGGYYHGTIREPL